MDRQAEAGVRAEQSGSINGSFEEMCTHTSLPPGEMSGSTTSAASQDVRLTDFEALVSKRLEEIDRKLSRALAASGGLN